MGLLLVAGLVLLAAAVISVVVRQGIATVNSDTADLGERYSRDSQQWVRDSTFPSLVTRVYISAAMRDADSQTLAGLGYGQIDKREIAWPRAPRLWVITWSRSQ